MLVAAPNRTSELRFQLLRKKRKPRYERNLVETPFTTTPAAYAAATMRAKWKKKRTRRLKRKRRKRTRPLAAATTLPRGSAVFSGGTEMLNLLLAILEASRRTGRVDVPAYI